MDRPAEALVSVVVIARDEGLHLLECLRSVARQSHRALDVVVVDDGSTDDTWAIAERVAAQDKRFRVLRLLGAGRAAARNEGVRATLGDLLCFVDGDDVLPDRAIETLLAAATATKAAVTSGELRPLDARGPRPLPAAAPLARPTLHGRLFRRAEWDRLGLAFDERLEVHEDLPVVVTALLHGRGTATVDGCTYLHRRHGRRPTATGLDLDPDVTLAGPPIDLTAGAPRRPAGGGPPAIPATTTAPGRTGRAQRRLEPAVLGALTSAVDRALEAVDASARRSRAIRPLLVQLLEGEPTAMLRVFDLATPAWRGAFATAAQGWLRRVRPDDLLDRPALERTAWSLLRDNRHEALALVLHEARRGQTPAPVRRRGRAHLGWATLDGLPPTATRLLTSDPAIGVQVALEDLHAHGGVLELGGRAQLGGAPAARVALRLVPRPGAARLRLPSSPVLLRTAASDTPGDFGTTLSPAAVREGNGWHTQTWDLWAEVTGAGNRRHTDRFAIPPGAQRTTFLPAGDRVLVRSTARPDGRVTLQVDTAWTCARRQRTALGGLLVLSGELRLPHADVGLELRRRGDGHRRRQPLQVDRARIPHGFEATIPLHDLAEAPAPLGGGGRTTGDAQQVWELWTTAGDTAHRVALPGDVPVAAWFVGDRVVSLLPDAAGDALLVEQERAPQAPRRPVARPAVPGLVLADER